MYQYNSQAYNSYSYCLNSPLRFTDPSGYAVEDYWDPFSIYSISKIKIKVDDLENLINKYGKFDTKESQGIWNIKLPFSYWLGGGDPIADNVRHSPGGCVMATNGCASRRLGKLWDNSNAWDKKNLAFHEHLLNLYENSSDIMNHPELLYGHYNAHAIDFLIWTDNGKYSSYEAEYIELKDVPKACCDGYQILIDFPLGSVRVDDGVIIKDWHRCILNSISIKKSGEYKMRVGDPAYPLKYLDDYSGAPVKGILPLPREEMKFIKFRVKH